MIVIKHTAAPEHLFRTDEELSKLSEEMSNLFHKITAQALWIGKRERPDLQLGMIFLCTRVKASDEHDYKKLQHYIVMYPEMIAFLPLILRADGKGTRLYNNGAHAVHADMKGHKGVYATIGTGAVYASSPKSKIDTVSSREIELVLVGKSYQSTICGLGTLE